MRAAYYERTGTASEVLTVGEVDTPQAGPGEALVRVMASGVNPSDVKKRAGWMQPPKTFPKTIPHSDGAGVIEAVGQGVDPSRVGQRVWLWNGQWGRSFGTAAERIALPEAQAVPLPDGVSFEEGACLGIPARTGWIAAHWGGAGVGKRVLVRGGAGAVGSAAVASAAAEGAEVIATASNEEKAAIATEAGATTIVRRDRDDAAEALAQIAGERGFDLIVEVDFGANWREDARLLSVNGAVATYSSTTAPRFEMEYYPFAQKAARLRFIQVYLLEAEERAAAHAGLDHLLRAGRLPIRVGARFPLEDCAAAHEAQEAGRVVGNIVVIPSHGA